MMEYPAMIYKNGRNRGFVANCVVNNLVGFGKTEEDAINNLKQSLQSLTKLCDINVKPLHGFLASE